MRAHRFCVLVLGGLLAACGDSREDRAATGGLSGAAMGALVGGPIGLLIGGGIGYATGTRLDKSADEKIEELASQPPPGKPAKQVAEEPKPRERSGSPERSKILTQAQIEDRLNAAGYRPVHTIRRDGPAYVARGERDGTLYDVRVDAVSGRLLASNEVGVRRPAGDGGGTTGAVMTEQQVRSILRQGGYEMVGDVERTGDRYRAEAMQDGTLYDLVVDGRTGRVVSATPSTAGAAPQNRQGG